VLEALSHGLTNKLLHAPTEALNQGGEGDQSLKDLVARLYRLRARS
jgi:glutamyl-tRNA reductase